MREHERIRNRMRVHDESREDGSLWAEWRRAVEKTVRMRALTLKSKAGSKCWLTPLYTHTHIHKNTHRDSLSLFQKRVHEMKQYHTTKAKVRQNSAGTRCD